MSSDLSVTFPLPATRAATSRNGTSITWSRTRNYRAAVSNAGPSTAQGVVLTLTATPPGTVAWADDLVGGCTPRPTNGRCSTTFTQVCDPTATAPGCPGTETCRGIVFPCDVGSVQDGTDTLVDFAMTMPVPVDAAGDVSWTGVACPANAVVTTTASVSTEGTGASTDPAGANNTGSIDQTHANTADLAATISGPATAGEGQTVQFSYNITNAGPCDSTALRMVLDPGPDVQNSFGLNFVSSSDAECDPGGFCIWSAPLAVGASRAFTVDWQVAPLLSGVISHAVWNGVGVYDNTMRFGSVFAGDVDPVNDDNYANTYTVVKNNKTTGCSSTGGVDGAGLLALLGLTGLVIRRRRS